MNTNIDLPKELLNEEGNIWINGKNGQLRYSSGKNKATSWVSPISTYNIGTRSKLKVGQPVSIGDLTQLASEASGIGESAVVLSDPSKNNFSVGILLEPGDVTSFKKIHVQSHGQIEYSLSNKDNDNYYLPPYRGDKFLWTYSDIGKPVYVSNKNKGELTLDLAEATYDNGNIICIGRIADAPLGTENLISYQKILIEVQLSGDVRGLVDTAQIAVDIGEKQSLTDIIQSEYDKIIPVKIIDGKGVLILGLEDLKSNIENDTLGVFVAKSENGEIDLNQYYNKTIVVTRLGIINGNFNFPENSFGKTAYIDKDCNISFESNNESIEYKVGVGFGPSKFLVDCRYSKSIAQTEMIGTIKPAFANNLTDVGFTLVDDKVHTVYDEEIDWKPLISQCYSKDIFVFSKSKTGPFTRVAEGGWELYGENTDNGILSRSRPTYWKFRDLYYTINGETCACQIKYVRDGAPEAQAYVWPEQCYQIAITPDTVGGSANNTDIRINISHLVDLGAYMDNNSQNIESYDIVVQEKNTKQTISPGFWQNKQGQWVGYEWQIVTNGSQTYLYMVTQPNESIDLNNCLGITWPIGAKATSNIDLFVTVRRRPTQYNSLYLNQYPIDNPWTPLVDSANNLVIQGDKIYLGGKVTRNEGQSGFTNEDNTSSAIEFNHTNGEKVAGLTYKIISPGSKADYFRETFVIGDGTNNRSISWTYDLTGENPVAELSAQFSASFVAESTKGEDSSNRYKDSALRIFNTLYPSIFRKKSSGIETIAVTNDIISKGIDYGYEFDIFNKDEVGENAKSLSLKVGANDMAISKAVSTSWVNKDRISYQSYLGLLARAAGETEERILKIERLLYGASFLKNYYTVLDTNNEENSTSFKYYLDDFGAMRALSFFANNAMLISPDNEFDFDFYKSAKSGNYKSLLLDFLVDNYGDYNSLDPTNENSLQNAYDRFNSLISKEDFENFISQDKTQKYSHLAELWNNYKNSSSEKEKQYLTRYMSKSNKTKFSRNTDTNVVLASQVCFSKLKNGYNTDGIKFDNSDGSPFFWPVYKDDNWEENANYSLEDNFFGNNIFGVSDEIGTALGDDNGSLYSKYEFSRFDDPENGKLGTFAPQSLEGIIYDIMIKLSFIRKKFDFYGRFDPKITYLNDAFTNIVFNKNGNIPIFESIKDGGNKFVDYQSTDKNIYSGFKFENDRIVAGYGISLIKDNLTQIDYTNDSIFGSENDSTLDIVQRWTDNSTSFNVDGLTKLTQFYVAYLFYLIGKYEATLKNNGYDATADETYQFIMGSLGNGLTIIKDDESENSDDNNGDEDEDEEEENSTQPQEEKIAKLPKNITPLYGKNEANDSVVTNSIFENNIKGKLFDCLSYAKKELDGETRYYPRISPKYSKVINSVEDWASLLVSGFNFESSTGAVGDIISFISGGFIDPNEKDKEKTALIKDLIINTGINEDYLYNAFVTYDDYVNNYCTAYPIMFMGKFDYNYSDNKNFLIKNLSYSDTIGLFRKKIIEEYYSNSELNKYKLFFGFINGTTNENSKYAKAFPWTQRPIANNGLKWEDKNGNFHSCDFNDFVQKKFYSYNGDLFTKAPNDDDNEGKKYYNNIKNESDNATTISRVVGKIPQFSGSSGTTLVFKPDCDVKDFEIIPNQADLDADQVKNQILVFDEYDESKYKLKTTSTDVNVELSSKNANFVESEILKKTSDDDYTIEQFDNEEEGEESSTKGLIKAKNIVGALKALSYLIGYELEFEDIKNVSKGLTVPIPSLEGKFYLSTGKKSEESAYMPEKRYKIRPFEKQSYPVSMVDVKKHNKILSKDNTTYDYEYYTFGNNTEKISEVTRVHETKFKDNSYINGQILPVPDIRENIDIEKILNAIRIGFTEEPNEFINYKENSNRFNLDINGFNVYDINDSGDRKINIYYNGSKYTINSIKIVVLDVSKNEKYANEKESSIAFDGIIRCDEKVDAAEKLPISLTKTNNFLFEISITNSDKIIGSKLSSVKSYNSSEVSTDVSFGTKTFYLDDWISYILENSNLYFIKSNNLKNVNGFLCLEDGIEDTALNLNADLIHAKQAMKQKLFTYEIEEE